MNSSLNLSAIESQIPEEEIIFQGQTSSQHDPHGSDTTETKIEEPGEWKHRQQKPTAQPPNNTRKTSQVKITPPVSDQYDDMEEEDDQKMPAQPITQPMNLKPGKQPSPKPVSSAASKAASTAPSSSARISNPNPKNPYWKDPYNKLAQRTHMIRYDIRRILVPASSDPMGVLVEALTTLLINLRKVDASVIIYPWKTTNFGLLKELGNPKTYFPADFQGVREYFNNIVPIHNGGEAFGQVFLGYSGEFKDLLSGLSWQYDTKAECPTLWEMPLQREKVVKLGWLLYSLPTTDKDLLTQAIYERTGVHVGLRWQMIGLGKPGPVPEDQKVRALHVELDQATNSCDNPKIQALYASTSAKNPVSDYPLGIRLRLVPMMDQIFLPQSRSDADKLRNRQASFVRHVQTVETWDIAALDTESPSLGNWTMREFLLQIPVHPANLADKLFILVDHQKEKQSIKLTYLPQNESVARNVMSSLYTVAYYHLSCMTGIQQTDLDGLYKFFTEAAYQRALTCTFDPVTGMVTSEADLYTNTLLGLDAEFDLTNMDEEIAGTQVVLTNTPTLA
jgi:hypothetical protein